MTNRIVNLSSISTEKGLVGGPFGSSLVNKDYRDSGVPVIRGTNLNVGRNVDGDFVFVSENKFREDLQRNSALPNDIVFTQRGTLGQVAIVPEGPFPIYVVSQSQMRLRVNPQIADTRYIYYACGSDNFKRQISDHAIATGVPHINLGILGRLEVPLPPLNVQNAIADVLSALDDKIAANTRLAEDTDSFINLQFRAAIQRSVPVVKPFLEVFNVEYGEAFKGDKFVEPGIGRPLIRIRDLKTFFSQVWTTESRSKEVIVNAGDVVVGMDAEFRATSWLGEPGLLNQRVCRVTSKLGNSAFVRESLRLPLATIENYKTGTTVIHLNKKDLEENTVLLPDREAIKFFESTAESLYRSRVALATENRILATTRDVLLPQLMSGKLRVRDAEALVESVV